VQALFTPTEGAAVGAVATGLYGIFTGGSDVAGLSRQRSGHGAGDRDDLLHRLGGEALQRVPRAHPAPTSWSTWIEASGYAPLVVLAIMLAAYLIFGCVMDSLSMILLTIPIFFPIIMSLDFVILGYALSPEEAAIWFGILALIVVEVGLITPPVGMNLFIINSMARDIPMVAHLCRRRAFRRVRPDPGGDPGDVPGDHAVAGGGALRLAD
jgi:TRAP-type C4-dicarboxylate transport system permease large subunit